MTSGQSVRSQPASPNHCLCMCLIVSSHWLAPPEQSLMQFLRHIDLTGMNFIVPYVLQLWKKCRSFSIFFFFFLFLHGRIKTYFWNVSTCSVRSDIYQFSFKGQKDYHGLTSRCFASSCSCRLWHSSRRCSTSCLVLVSWLFSRSASSCRRNHSVVCLLLWLWSTSSFPG